MFLVIVILVLAYGWLLWELKRGRIGKISRSDSPAGFWVAWLVAVALVTFMGFRVLPQFFQ